MVNEYSNIIKHRDKAAYNVSLNVAKDDVVVVEREHKRDEKGEAGPELAKTREAGKQV